jgi:hypothetical protein
VRARATGATATKSEIPTPIVKIDNTTDAFATKVSPPPTAAAADAAAADEARENRD